MDVYSDPLCPPALRRLEEILPLDLDHPAVRMMPHDSLDLSVLQIGLDAFEVTRERGKGTPRIFRSTPSRIASALRRNILGVPFPGFDCLRKVRRDAIANLLAQSRMRVRVHAFSGEHSVGESIDFNWRLTLQATLICRW